MAVFTRKAAFHGFLASVTSIDIFADGFGIGSKRCPEFKNDD
jgi:hypothetical protein